jgi:hypothetical protein
LGPEKDAMEGGVAALLDLENEEFFAFFARLDHFDGDCPWKIREKSTNVNDNHGI